MKRRLQTRLALAYASLALLVLIGAAVSLQSVKAQRDLLERGIAPGLRVLNLAEQLREAASDSQRLAFQAGIERREDLLYQAGVAAAKFFAAHEALAAAIRELPVASAEPGRLMAYHERIAASFRRIMASSLSMLAETIEQGETQEAWMAQLRLASHGLGDDIDGFVDVARANLDGRIEQGRTRLERLAQTLWAGIAVAGLGLAAFLLILLRQVNRPMRAINGFVGRACADPLGTTERHVPLYDDEIGALGGGINHLLDRLQQLAVSRDSALTEVAARKAAENDLLRRSHVFKAVAEASRRLLARDEEHDAILAALGIFAASVDADRAYIFEVSAPTPGSPEGRISQIYVWCATGVTAPSGDGYRNSPWHLQLPRWIGMLNAGYAVEGPIAEFPQEERDYFAARGIVSLLCVPIFMDENLWGFAGLDDCRAPRRWSEFEQDALARVAADIAQTEIRRRDADAMRLSAQVFENSGEAITVTDAGGAIVSVNRAFCEITGYAAHEVLGRNPSVLKSGRHDAAFYRQMWGELGTKGRWQGEIWNRRKNGEIYPEWLDISAVRTRAGGVSHYVAIFSDITERKSSQARIEYLAHHDPLTGLPNRMLLLERIERDIARARREGNLVAALFLDLDHFKRINDSLGHAAGDRLLRTVAERLRGCVRETDTVSRQGGDEFVVILGELASPAVAAQVAGKILHALEEPVEIGSQRLHISTSIGIAVFPHDGHSAPALLKNADTAMYCAKDAGRNAFRFFENEMNVRAQERLRMEARLREALPSGQLIVYYQPLVRVGDNAIVGAEALLRWQTPDQGMIPPSRFIPVAEESGLIVPIGAWVLNEACRQAAAWAQMGYAMKIAVNVSAVQVKRTDLVATVKQALDESGLPPPALELEITESLLMGDDQATRKMLESLIALGVRISIDDFGTGYSNLAYLHRFSIDKLKIDQAFVQQASSGSEAIAIINAIVNMARSLGMTVLAEGVETEEQLKMLKVLRCEEVQGYLLGRPAPAATLTTRLNDILANRAA